MKSCLKKAEVTFITRFVTVEFKENKYQVIKTLFCLKTFSLSSRVIDIQESEEMAIASAKIRSELNNWYYVPKNSRVITYTKLSQLYRVLELTLEANTVFQIRCVKTHRAAIAAALFLASRENSETPYALVPPKKIFI